MYLYPGHPVFFLIGELLSPSPVEASLKFSLLGQQTWVQRSCASSSFSGSHHCSGLSNPGTLHLSFQNQPPKTLIRGGKLSNKGDHVQFCVAGFQIRDENHKFILNTVQQRMSSAYHWHSDAESWLDTHGFYAVMASGSSWILIVQVLLNLRFYRNCRIGHYPWHWALSAKSVK